MAKKAHVVAAAEILDVDQPKVSALIRGRLAGFSLDRLVRFLVLLGSDVEIVVKQRSLPFSLRKRVDAARLCAPSPIAILKADHAAKWLALAKRQLQPLRVPRSAICIRSELIERRLPYRLWRVRLQPQWLCSERT